MVERSRSHSLCFTLLLLLVTLVDVGHCQSLFKDNSVHILNYQEEFKIQFRPYFIGPTRYTCSLVWDDKSHWLDV
ncbi:hypothetical protein Lal_00042959 [Lupinus albus]|nr:hypothetical protein Lal_00042959 [Lupinus albus]